MIFTVQMKTVTVLVIDTAKGLCILITGLLLHSGKAFRGSANLGLCVGCGWLSRCTRSKAGAVCVCVCVCVAGEVGGVPRGRKIDRVVPCATLGSDLVLSCT